MPVTLQVHGGEKGEATLQHGISTRNIEVQRTHSGLRGSDVQIVVVRRKSVARQHSEAKKENGRTLRCTMEKHGEGAKECNNRE